MIQESIPSNQRSELASELSKLKDNGNLVTIYNYDKFRDKVLAIVHGLDVDVRNNMYSARQFNEKLQNNKKKLEAQQMSWYDDPWYQLVSDYEILVGHLMNASAYKTWIIQFFSICLERMDELIGSFKEQHLELGKIQAEKEMLESTIKFLRETSSSRDQTQITSFLEQNRQSLGLLQETLGKQADIIAVLAERVKNIESKKKEITDTIAREEAESAGKPSMPPYKETKTTPIPQSSNGHIPLEIPSSEVNQEATKALDELPIPPSPPIDISTGSSHLKTSFEKSNPSSVDDEGDLPEVPPEIESRIFQHFENKSVLPSVKSWDDTYLYIETPDEIEEILNKGEIELNTRLEKMQFLEEIEKNYSDYIYSKDALAQLLGVSKHKLNEMLDVLKLRKLKLA